MSSISVTVDLPDHQAPNSDHPTVFVVEDDKSVRVALKRVFELAGLRVEVFGTASEMICKYNPGNPGCLVVDLGLPDMTGLELQAKLAKLGCVSPFIVITGNGEVSDATRAMRMGAVDFVEKPFSREFILRRVMEALDRDAKVREENAFRADTEMRLERLTPREKEILDMVVSGQLSKQIARELNLSVKTVEVHRSNVTKKMEVKSVVQLVQMMTRYTSLP